MRWACGDDHVATALTVEASAIIAEPDRAHVQPALISLADVCAILGEVHAGADSAERVRAWLRAPHPRPAGRAPLADLLAGRARDVEQWMARAWLGDPDVPSRQRAVWAEAECTHAVGIVAPPAATSGACSSAGVTTHRTRSNTRAASPDTIAANGVTGCPCALGSIACGVASKATSSSGLSRQPTTALSCEIAS